MRAAQLDPHNDQQRAVVEKAHGRSVAADPFAHRPDQVPHHLQITFAANAQVCMQIIARSTEAAAPVQRL